MPKDFSVEGKRVKFLRADGTLAENQVGCWGNDKDGNLCFWEIAADKIVRPKIDGKEKYCRVLIRRVEPIIIAEDM